MMTRPGLVHDDVATLSGEDAATVAGHILLDQRTRFARAGGRHGIGIGMPTAARETQPRCWDCRTNQDQERYGSDNREAVERSAIEWRLAISEQGSHARCRSTYTRAPCKRRRTINCHALSVAPAVRPPT